MTRDFAAIPYLEAADWQREVGPQTKRNIVIHSMEYPEKPDSAEWCSRFFAGQEGKPPGVSAHACVDSDSIVQCVPWDRIAWHAPGCNRQGIGIEHAGFGAQTTEGWRDVFSMRMLDLSAWLCAELCRRFSIPIVFCDAAALRAGLPGITTHAMVADAFRKSTHQDPGRSFPMQNYLALVASYSGNGGQV